MFYNKVFLISLFLIVGFFAHSQTSMDIPVSGSCDMCQLTIESTSLDVIGVESAEWDSEKQHLTITYDEVLFDKRELIDQLLKSGYDADGEKAPNEIYDALPVCCQYRIEETASEIQFDADEEGDIQNLLVYGTCGMCKHRIEQAALEVIGVTKAKWDISSLILSVEIAEGLFDMKELHAKMAFIGHDTQKEKADTKTYDGLDECCKYRDILDYDKINVTDNPNETITFKLPSGTEEDLENKIVGMVYEHSADGSIAPLIGATVQLFGKNEGTSTDVDGFFELQKPKKEFSDQIIVSYLGYENDTIALDGNTIVSITLKTSNILDEVEITHKKKSTSISFINPIKVQNIGQKELIKAACCNLSESFETNPSVDVSATDAATGTRKIELLGLAGPYVQVTRENMPYIRGLASIFGFGYTPGPWIESIQLNLGAGSVVNGPESMTGQINIEIKKPELSEKLYLNLYSNAAGRLEANVNQAFKINDKWSTGYLFHGNRLETSQDRNNDQFQDMPDNRELIVMNRWKYANGKGRFMQFGVKGTYVGKEAGQLSGSEDLWRATIDNKRLEGWAKIGKVFEDRPYASYGLQLNASYHDQEARFGSNLYDAEQTTLYANFIYQTIIKNADHKIKYGASIQYDDVFEELSFANFSREEVLSGVFTEYQYSPNDKFTSVIGLRADYHNNFGLFFTPRVHLKYNPNETTSWRFAFGRGQRTASIFAENIGLFASNRRVDVFRDFTRETPYGLDPEVSYNIGLNFTKEWTINDRAAIFGIDYYYTTFTSQIVVDYEQPERVLFYNLDGLSYSHSIQTQIDYELFDGFDARVAYRFNDPQTTFVEGRKIRPLTSRHRAFLNLSYETENGWAVDGTLNWRSSARIPSTTSNPAEYKFDTQSPSFATINGQVSKEIKKDFTVYLGGENLLDFRQENAILQSEDPFGDFFDASLVWGPIQGRVVYVGLRYAIQ